MSIQKTISLGGGKTATLTFNKFAPQANGSVMAQMGSTMILATAVCGGVDNSKDYFPLSVDFIHKLYAGGQIKGGKWSKRDVGGGDADILDSRIVDRSIRPLFPADFKYETQVIATLMSSDKSVDTIVLGFLSSALALAVSDIPFNGPVSAVRIARVAGKLIVQPTSEELATSDLDLLVCTGPWGVNMIESDGKQIDNETMYQAIELAVATSKDINSQISAIVKEVGKEKFTYESTKKDDITKKIVSRNQKDIDQFLVGGADGGHRKSEAKLHQAVHTAFEKELVAEEISENDLNSCLDKELERQFRNKMMTQNWRFDGRAFDKIRPLSMEVGVLPGTHGSAFFQRGLTQAVTNVSLNTLEEKLYTQDSFGEAEKTYMHFYSAMPFSTGEPGRTGRPGRREVGHGALAEKALIAVLPSKEQFPYTIVLTSEVLSQNGSSSMASTCGSTMALLDAGVPILSHVAGVSTGMVSDGDDNFKLITDIAGIEDHFGDMDFKITGTRTGITAIQLDIKRQGLTLEMIKQTLQRSFESRQEILDLMEKTLPSHRPQLAPHAPKIIMLQLPEDKIGEVIGKGGETIKGLMEKFGVNIDIDDAGTCSISGTAQDQLISCRDTIANMIKDVEVGESYTGTVVDIRDFGAFLEILPGKQALLHVSEMATGFIKDVSSIIKLGDSIKVTVSGFNDEGKIKLSAPEFKAAHTGETRQAPQSGYNRDVRSDNRFVGERHASPAPRFSNFHPPAGGTRPMRKPMPNRVGFKKPQE